MSKWKKVKLGDIATYINGCAFKPSDWSNQGVPIVRIQNLTGSFSETNYYDKHYNSKYEINNGDVLISWSASLGVYVWDKGRAILNQHIFKVVFNKIDIDKTYFIFAVKSLLEKMEKQTHGATMKHITKPLFDNMEFPFPPMEEQKKIAARLDAVSDLLAKQKQLLSEQDNLIQSTFYDMFGTPEINEKGFPAHKISEICELNPKKPKEIDDNTECSFVPMSAVSEDGELNLTQIKLYEDVKKGFTYFAEEDVLFAKITPCMENGKGTIAKGLKNKLGFGSTEFHVLRPLNDISNARWLFQITKFKKFRENAEKSMTGSAGQKRVPAGFFDNYFIPVPPLELQEKFAAIVEQIESEKSKIKSAIAETQTLFNALMSEYFEE